MPLDAVQFAPRGKVGFMRIFARLIASDVVVAAKGLDLRLPLISALFKRHACVSRSVLGGVLHVLVLRNGTKICPSVVRPDAVNVIDLKLRERSGHVEEGKPMLSYGGAIDNRISITIARVDTTNNGTGEPAPSADSTRENARLRVIVKKLAQTLRGKIGLSHDAPQMLIGQRLAGAVNAARASLFSRIRTACAMGAA